MIWLLAPAGIAVAGWLAVRRADRRIEHRFNAGTEQPRPPSTGISRGEW